jgi:molybdate transport system substrate-binding protein
VKKLLGVLAALPLLHASAADLHFFAAASLTDAVREIASNFEQETGTKVKLNFGASNLLARQIEEGAPADVFLSADDAKMDQLAKRNLIDPDSRRNVLSNSLVIVARTDSPLTIAAPKDLLQPVVKKIALADPQAVPAGIYAREYLKRVQLFEQISERILPTENVRAALAAVEAGNADAAFVYKTDAAISKEVRVVFSVPVADTPPINYPVAIIRETKARAEAEQFINYLRSPAAIKVFEEYGFIIKP